MADESREVLISAELLVDMFRAGNVLEERVVDVTEGIPADAKLIGAEYRPFTGQFALLLDRPSPTPVFRWRKLEKAV